MIARAETVPMPDRWIAAYKEARTSRGILGITKLDITHEVDSLVQISATFVAHPGYDATHLINENWRDLFPGNTIVKCNHCGQFGARKCACKYCGAPIQ